MRNNAVRDMRGHFNVLLEFHGEGRATLTHGTDRGRVLEHLRQRHFGRDRLAGRRIFHALDLTATTIQITGMDEQPSGKVITAEVPLSEMFGYATTVRSMSQGRATFTMEFEKYVEVPSHISDSIIKN